MNLKSKKLLSLFLIFSLVMLSTNLYAKERRGAKLIVTKNDGQQIEGELSQLNRIHFFYWILKEKMCLLVLRILRLLEL